MINKKKLEKDVKQTGSAKEMFKMEEKLKKLKDKKKELAKRLIDVQYDSQHIGKNLKNAEHDPEDPNEIDNIIYKIKAVKKKKTHLIEENDKQKLVLEKLTERIETAKKKLENERQKVETLENRNNRRSKREGTQRSQSIEDISNYNTNSEDQKCQEYLKQLKELKRENKEK